MLTRHNSLRTPRDVELINALMRLELDKRQLNEVSEYQYLGTILDNRLNGTKQFNMIVQQMAVKLHNFSKIRYLIDTQTALRIYKTTILPLLDYNDIIYNIITEQQKRKLQST